MEDDRERGFPTLDFDGEEERAVQLLFAVGDFCRMGREILAPHFTRTESTSEIMDEFENAPLGSLVRMDNQSTMDWIQLCLARWQDKIVSSLVAEAREDPGNDSLTRVIDGYRDLRRVAAGMGARGSRSHATPRSA
jgi:hypothetical protein